MVIGVSPSEDSVVDEVQGKEVSLLFEYTCVNERVDTLVGEAS